MAAALAVAGLGKRFGRTVALDDVTVSVDSGAAVAVFGPNGAGKTTFLRLCATLLRPSQGTVTLFGIDASRDGAAVRRRIGVLGHESFLYGDLTATENLRFYAKLFRLPEPNARIAALLSRLDLVGWSHRPLRTLSRGLVQRCALARTLLHRPDLIMLDEPFTGLDLEATEALHAVLREAQREGATLLLSTHDIAHGLALCDVALVLVRGRVAFHGSIGPEPAAFEAEYRRLSRAEPAPSALSGSPSLPRRGSGGGIPGPSPS